MKLKRSTIASAPSALIDAVMDGYVAWREESAAVETAYGNWLRAGPGDEVLAWAAYCGALDREERAADTYRRLIAIANGAGVNEAGVS